MPLNNPVLIAERITRLMAEDNTKLTTALNFDTPFQLLIATILSAQCTDNRVNIITQNLFASHPTMEAINELPLATLESYIKSAGLWRTKARNIKRTTELLLTKFNGTVPKTREELIQLPGVGRKTANVVLSNAFNIPAFPVDTHVHRVTNRLGLVNSKTAAETEEGLAKLFPATLWNQTHLWIINHGRQTCHARRPACPDCKLNDICQFKNQNQ